MFTGIIKDIGEITSIIGDAKKAITIEVKTCLPQENITIGSSIACDGICLTATEITPTKGNIWSFKADLSAETLNLTTAKNWQVGGRLNLESSLKIGDEISGHLVSGHIDDVAEIKTLQELPEGNWLLSIKMPKEFERFIIKKGSITINGVSLTINEASDESFEINLIPHTYQQTNFKYLQAGSLINFEIDMLARYAVGRVKGI